MPLISILSPDGGLAPVGGPAARSFHDQRAGGEAAAVTSCSRASSAVRRTEARVAGAGHVRYPLERTRASLPGFSRDLLPVVTADDTSDPDRACRLFAALTGTGKIAAEGKIRSAQKGAQKSRPFASQQSA